MNPREQGFLLLTSSLGDPERKPLTVAQFRNLAKRAKLLSQDHLDRDMTEEDLVSVGYDRKSAVRILDLLSQKQQLQWYVSRGWSLDCFPITRINESYPQMLREKLGADSPGCLWAKGDIRLLQTQMISLVGSRDLLQYNREFAKEVGKQAALQGFTLVTGNARGADQTALEACLYWGGNVISVVPDNLSEHPLQNHVLFLSEEDYDSEFSPQRALSRNRVIHCLGAVTFVAQCNLGKGGTWDGTTKNLRHSWSPVHFCDDQSAASAELIRLGAIPAATEDLGNIKKMCEPTTNLFEMKLT